MQNQKTTSFSKILANKNNNNNNSTQVLATQQETTTTPTTNPFYIDQTKKNQAQQNFLLNNYTTNPKNLTVRHKSWRSDTNLSSRLIFADQSEHNCYQAASPLDEEQEEDEDEEEADFDDQGLDDDLDNSNLEFSDHAGLYDVLNDYKNFDFSTTQFNTRQNLSKYDVYKLKKNYKLTFTKKNIRQMSRMNNQQEVMLNQQNNNNNNNNGEESLVFSSLSGNQFNKFNFDDYVNNGEESDEEDLYEDEEEEEEEEEDDEDEENQELDPTTSYLDQISKDILLLNNTGDENQLMDENIMNWSMKLSAHDQFVKRSQSRSPAPSSNKKNSIKQLKNLSNFQENFQTHNRCLNTQFQNFNQLKNFQQLKLEHHQHHQQQQQQHQQNHQQQQQQQQNNKKCSSTTSWGKLKNSKSNSSNVGLSSQSITNSNEESQFSNLNNNNESLTFGSKSINNSQLTQTLPSNASPHLYKVFQSSKANLNSTHLDETTASSTSGSDFSFQYNPSTAAANRNSRKVPNESQATKKTSFSQLRQRSLSSCAIATSSKNEAPKMKKSIGIQHEPEACYNEQNMDTSPTILCMVVDKNNKLNKKDLLLAAAKAKAMANQAGVLKIQKPQNSSSKRSSSLFNAKHSLPDLTFLAHYSDKNPQPMASTSSNKPSTPNPQSVQNEILKRKTLKSIKRYRQTKQNTEPCAVQIVAPRVKEIDMDGKFERRPSLPFNERGKNPLNSLNTKQPLKSCLKRKESQLRQSQSLQTTLNKTHKLTKSTMMFVPFVGYLFSCDLDSSTRYFYYNNLEKNRRNKIYKQLTNELDTEDDENTTEEEDERGVNHKKEIDMCKSDNDLRIKKVVKFKPVKLRQVQMVRKEAPLLQYDTLIAMLKSSKEKKPQPPTSLNLVKNSNTIDADSISLASLSESPPSEFKFSDDEENPMIKTNVLNNKLEHVKNLKRNFHSILLKDTKLNNLKEILLELKTQQEKVGNKFDTPQCSSTTSSTSFSGNSSSTSTCSSITSPNLLNSSIEMKESIERLATYLFDFLRQNIKPASSDCLLPTSNLFKSTIDSPLLNVKKPNQLAESNTLTQTFSQYTQIWNLIECTMNVNLEQQRQPTGEYQATKCIFTLPKEAYLTMFQEINKFASSTNQTYLIDNSINTSQLRRKHHFMVMLMSLKFKFQLFIVYLLNHKQLANWFEHVNRDRNLVKTFYDLKNCLTSSNKTLANNSSGDSGMGNEFMQISTSSSTCSSSLSTSMTQQSPNLVINEANFNVKSLASISIFENDEYFSYFHKVLQQFNLIDIKLNSHQNDQPPQTQAKPTPPPPPPNPPQPLQHTKPHAPPTPVVSRFKQMDTKTTLNRNHIPKPVQSNYQNVQNGQTIVKKSVTSLNNQSNSGLLNHHQSGTQAHHSHSGFNLKNISKRFNIKSWFTSSNSNSNIPSSASHNTFTSNTIQSNTSATQSNSRLPIGIKTLTPTNRFNNSKKHTRRDSSALKVCDVNGSGVLDSGVGALISNNTTNLMKHSLSEPSLNAILDR